MTLALYSRDILRLAASIPHRGGSSAPQASVEKSVAGLRQPGGRRLDHRRGGAGWPRSARRCAPARSARPRRRLMGAHAIGRTPPSSPQARDALAAYLAGAPRRSRRLAGPCRVRRGAALHRAPRRHPARRSRPRPRPPRRRAGAMNEVRRGGRLAAPRRGDPARLRAGLRAAVPPARARRDPGLSRRRRAGRAAAARPGRRRARACSTSPSSASCCCSSWSGSSSIRRGCGGCGTIFSASACSRSCSAGSPSPALVWLATSSRGRRGARARPAARSVLDRAGAAAAAVGRAAAHAVRRARLLDPALPGPVDRAADHHRRGDVAQSRPTPAGRRAGCSRSTRSARSSGWCWPAASCCGRCSG